MLFHDLAAIFGNFEASPLDRLRERGPLAAFSARRDKRASNGLFFTGSRSRAGGSRFGSSTQ
jgi:hypothetical protein